ncbi:hypothetical protein HPB52_012063 [Rhipicephalus sanguineus]|uniref:Uncharacterized protein n=1 Tax=Rhipicephalus sanguineus TaxID=34632 RepID=A0A9D4T1X8_RHISA|nr:hypothetical protein HPB52_012063 [Rhipicephalus sanguineus]
MSPSNRNPSIGYTTVQGCTGQHLAEVTRHIIKKEADVGFHIVRVVTDNHKINAAAMDILWFEGPPLAKPRAFPAVASLGEKLWLIGGCYDNSESRLILVSLRDVDVLEPSGWGGTNIYVIGGTSSVLNGPIKRPEFYLQQDNRYKFPAEYPEAMTGISAVSVPPVTPTFRSRSLTCMITDALAE